MSSIFFVNMTSGNLNNLIDSRNSEFPIRLLNDIARSELSLPDIDKSVPCSIYLANGVSTVECVALVDNVIAHQFDSKATSLYSDHECGGFVYKSVAHIWKFDYFAKGGDVESINPADKSITDRVLTIMLDI